MDKFKALTERFAYNDPNTATVSTPKVNTHRSKVSKSRLKSTRKAILPLNAKNLPDLKPLLAPNLKLLLIGYNPSIKSAQTGHVFAHPTNVFWKLIYESGIVPIKLKPEDDVTMPERFQIGFTDLIHRPTKGTSDLTQDEMRRAVPELLASIRDYDPKVICLVGKGIWDHLTKNLGVKVKDFTWGEQQLKQLKARVYVVPSTSGLVRIPKADQLDIWKGLKRLLDEVDYPK